MADETTRPGSSTDSSLAEALDELRAAAARVAEVRSRNRDAVLRQVKEAISLYEIRPDEVGFDAQLPAASPPGGPPRQLSPRAGVKIPIKYRGPNGEEWSGRGKSPVWLTQLERNGHRREEFLVGEP